MLSGPCCLKGLAIVLLHEQVMYMCEAQTDLHSMDCMLCQNMSLILPASCSCCSQHEGKDTDFCDQAAAAGVITHKLCKAIDIMCHARVRMALQQTIVQSSQG